MILGCFVQLVVLVIAPRIAEAMYASSKSEDIPENPCSSIAGRPTPEVLQEANNYCKGVLRRALRHPAFTDWGERAVDVKCTPRRTNPGEIKYRCTMRLMLHRLKCIPGSRVDLADYFKDSSFWVHRLTFFTDDVPELIKANNALIQKVESIKIEKEWNNMAVYASLGLREHMEDRFVVYEKASGTRASFFGVFDGHAGEYAASYVRDNLMKTLVNKVAALRKSIRRNRNPGSGSDSDTSAERRSEILHIGLSGSCKSALSGPWRSTEDKVGKIQPMHEEPTNTRKRRLPKSRTKRKEGFNNYLLPGGIIDYKNLLTDVFLATDKALCKTTEQLGTVAGTTALVAIIEGSRLIVANVGDSRGVMCDSEGFAVPLSFDHKPDREDEKRRIEAAGGTVEFKLNGWRTDGYLAVSRALGDHSEKGKNHLIANPEVLIFDLSDYKPQFLVLASDGLYDVLTNEEVVDFIRERLTEQYFGAKMLVRFAYLMGANDNITVMVINLKGYSWPRSSTATANKSQKSRTSFLSSRRSRGG